MTADFVLPYPVGYQFGKEHTFEPEQVKSFAVLAGDTNPLHHDLQAAQRSRFGTLIVSGTHSTALLLGLTADHFAHRGSVVGLGFSVEFLRAVAATARVSLEWQVTGATQWRNGPGHVLELAGSLRDEEGDLCVRATGRVLVGAEL